MGGALVRAKRCLNYSEYWGLMVRPERFELPAFWFVARRSIQLSYGRTRVVSCETLHRLSGFRQRRN